MKKPRLLQPIPKKHLPRTCVRSGGKNSRLRRWCFERDRLKIRSYFFACSLRAVSAIQWATDPPVTSSQDMADPTRRSEISRICRQVLPVLDTSTLKAIESPASTISFSPMSSCGVVAENMRGSIGGRELGHTGIVELSYGSRVFASLQTRVADGSVPNDRVPRLNTA